MTRWDHWKVQGEFNYRCEALERRQDEQFSEARVEFKNIDNRFEEVRGQMHAMQHNLGHQNEALGRALASTDEKLQHIIDGLARTRSRESSSSRHSSSESSAPRRHASRHRDGPVLQSMSSSQAVPSPRHAATSSYDGDLSARPPRHEANRPQHRALVIQQEQPHVDHQAHRQRCVPSTTSEASEVDGQDHRRRDALEDPRRRHHRHERQCRQHDHHDEPPPIKKKESIPLRMRLDVLLATWRKTMLLGINHDKNKSKLPKLVVRINKLLLVLNRANNTSKLPKLIAQTKFHNQTRHLNNRKSNAIITKQDIRARMMKMAT